MSRLRRLGETLGLVAPAGLEGVIPAGEEVLATATTDAGGRLAVTPVGLWVPDADGARRIGWHLISKAAWSDGALTLTEADEVGPAGDAVLLADRAPVRWPLAHPGKVPEFVRRRVDGSIRARHRKELADGGAWFVLRKIPGRDGAVLQVRPDAGTDPETAAAIAREAAHELPPPER